ncbi:MAG: two-component histidine kinase [Acidobacteria bacterium]|nr:two-component histidine kinase [Acidobacteriota bacterium]
MEKQKAETSPPKALRKPFPGTALYGLLSLLGLFLVTLIGHAMALNPSTVGFAFLIVVLLSSLRGGLLVGTLASIAATLCYNFFFLPPLHTFAIRDPSNWIALAAFLVTSVTVSRLVIAARVQAERAEQRRTELETLYALRERYIEETAHVEALRESEALKTSLLRAISHDLTTPLTAITIHTETLKRRAAESERRDAAAVERGAAVRERRDATGNAELRDAAGDLELRIAAAGIADETGRLRRRIDNLLAMARLEAGKASPHPEPTPPADLFRAVRENLPLVFASRPVAIHVDDDCPDAHVDPSLALEILVNLIENADRVSPPGAPLELRARRHPIDRNAPPGALDAPSGARPSQVRLEVLDRGPGLPPAPTSDIAQRGLGLEIARALAAANGGSITLGPREGGGTVAGVELPAAVYR